MTVYGPFIEEGAPANQIQFIPNPQGTSNEQSMRSFPVNSSMTINKRAPIQPVNEKTCLESSSRVGRRSMRGENTTESFKLLLVFHIPSRTPNRY